MASPVGGVLTVLVDGQRIKAKGDYTFNKGALMRSEVVGADGDVDYTEKPQAPFIEGKATALGDSPLSIDEFTNIVGADVQLEVGGKTAILRGAFYANEGNVGTAEGELDLKFVGSVMEIV